MHNAGAQDTHNVKIDISLGHNLRPAAPRQFLGSKLRILTAYGSWWVDAMQLLGWSATKVEEIRLPFPSAKSCYLPKIPRIKKKALQIQRSDNSISLLYINGTPQPPKMFWA